MDKMKLIVALLIALAVIAVHAGSNLAVPFLAFVHTGITPVQVPPDSQTTVQSQMTISVSPPTLQPAIYFKSHGTISMDLRPSYRVVAAGVGETWFQIALDGSRKPCEHRVPVNLALVLDRSASMAAKNKLECAKAAAKLAVAQLGASDTVAIVAFDSVSTILLPSTPVRDLTAIDAIIDNISPGGSTNLSDGLADGRNEVARQMSKGHVNRVILMTDGLANFGVTDPEALAAIARQMGNQGISVTTIGVGDEYNETLLVNLAEYSGGRYHYVANPQTMAAIFQREVRDLLQVVARNVQIEISPASGTTITQVLGSKASRHDGATWIVPLGDIYSGQQRHLYVRVALDAAKAFTATSLGSVRLSYSDETRGGASGSALGSVIVSRLNSSAAVEASADLDVLAAIQKVLGANRIEEAVIQVESGHAADAQRLLLEQSSQILKINPRMHSKDLEQLQREYREAQQSLQGLDLDSEAGRSTLKQIRFGAYTLSR